MSLQFFDISFYGQEDSALRPYQLKAKEDILKAWGSVGSVMLQMPTGTGKTRLFVSLIADIRKTVPEAGVLIVTHRHELVVQISRSLSGHYRLSHGVLAGRLSRNESEPVIVASIQTLARRGEGRMPRNIDYIIVDEAHHSLAASYRALWERYPEAKKLGVTATPYRLRRAAFTRLYDVLLESMPVRSFIDEGYLADYRYFTVSGRRALMQKVNRLARSGADGDYLAEDLDELCNTDQEIGFLWDSFEKFAGGRKGIVYAVSQEHGRRIASYFRKRGVVAVSVDCNTPGKERAGCLESFRKGDIQVLVNVELFTEGFDCPSIGFIILARPTRSLALYLQQVGRGLRPSPDGSDVLILDAAGLQGRFGLPDRRRDWASHFYNIKSRSEDYSRPLGNAGLSSSVAMEEVTRRPSGESVEATVHGWSVCHISGMQNILDRNGRPVLKRSLLTELKEDADGNYSALTGTREAHFEDRRPIRFTPELRLIPERCTEIGGMTFYAFTQRFVPFVDDGRTGRLQVMGYTVSLDLDSFLYDKVRLWNADWALLESRSYYPRCTGRGMYPRTVPCTLGTIEGKEYILTEKFIVGKADAGDLYYRLPCCMSVYYRESDGRSILYNARLEPLWSGERVDVLHDSLVLHEPDGTVRKVSYPDLAVNQSER